MRQKKRSDEDKEEGLVATIPMLNIYKIVETKIRSRSLCELLSETYYRYGSQLKNYLV